MVNIVQWVRPRLSVGEWVMLPMSWNIKMVFLNAVSATLNSYEMFTTDVELR